MAGLHARRTPHWNSPPTEKDEVDGAAPTKGNDTSTLIPTVARASTPYSPIEMAGTRACSSPCQNSSPVKPFIDEPAKRVLGVLINHNGSCAPIPISARAYWLHRSSLQ